MNPTAIPGHFDNAREKGTFNDADEHQIQQMIDLLPTLKGDYLFHLERWIDGDQMAFSCWHKFEFPTGVDWFIHYLRDTE